MSALSAGNSSDKATALLNTSGYTLEQGLTSVASVENLLAGELPLLNTREFTLVKGLIHVGNVGKPSLEAPALFNTVEFIPGKGPMSVTSVENHSDKSLSSFSIK